MKGDISSIFQTVLLAIIMLAVIVAAFIAAVFSRFSSVDELELIGINNRPYSLLEGLSSYKPNDRSFLENALEASITGSLARSGSQSIQAPVIGFMDFFQLKSYQLLITKGNNNIFTANNFVVTCGDGNGICTSTTRQTNACGEGREQLSDSSTCSRSQVCCSFAIQNAKKCGANLEGVCTTSLVTAPDLGRKLNTCGEGRELINDNGQCSAAQVCCKYLGLTDIGIASGAEMPLVYKGEKTGQVSVEVSGR